MSFLVAHSDSFLSPFRFGSMNDIASENNKCKIDFSPHSHHLTRSAPLVHTAEQSRDSSHIQIHTHSPAHMHIIFTAEPNGWILMHNDKIHCSEVGCRFIKNIIAIAMCISYAIRDGFQLVADGHFGVKETTTTIFFRIKSEHFKMFCNKHNEKINNRLLKVYIFVSQWSNRREKRKPPEVSHTLQYFPSIFPKQFSFFFFFFLKFHFVFSLSLYFLSSHNCFSCFIFIFVPSFGCYIHICCALLPCFAV